MEPIITKLRVGKGVYGLNLIEKKMEENLAKYDREQSAKTRFSIWEF